MPGFQGSLDSSLHVKVCINMESESFRLVFRVRKPLTYKKLVCIKSVLFVGPGLFDSNCFNPELSQQKLNLCLVHHGTVLEGSFLFLLF